MTAVSNPNSSPPSAPTTVPLTTYELMLMHSPWQQLAKLYLVMPEGYDPSLQEEPPAVQRKSKHRETTNITRCTRRLHFHWEDTLCREDKARPAPPGQSQTRHMRGMQKSRGPGWSRLLRVLEQAYSMHLRRCGS